MIGGTAISNQNDNVDVKQLVELLRNKSKSPQRSAMQETQQIQTPFYPEDKSKSWTEDEWLGFSDPLAQQQPPMSQQMIDRSQGSPNLAKFDMQLAMQMLNKALAMSEQERSAAIEALKNNLSEQQAGQLAAIANLMKTFLN
ncbi:MAG: hypothetical protein FWG10_06130 [Eubacteriaceae bacterium]|nr:hypothetical protein [Eubacteriaceae bacterium]